MQQDQAGARRNYRPADEDGSPPAPGKPDAAASPPSGKALSAAARRALDEAKQRRMARDAASALARPPPKEVNGRDGPDPVRYGDWELKGIISDF